MMQDGAANHAARPGTSAACWQLSGNLAACIFQWRLAIPLPWQSLLIELFSARVYHVFMPKKNSSDVSIAFTNALQPIRRVWVQAATIALADFGLPMSLSTAVILTSRAGAQGIQQNVLAEEVGVNPGAMVRILDQGEVAGLLKRHESTEDRRVKIVQILPKGQELATKMEAVVAALRTSLVGDLPAADIEIATRVLRDFEGRITAFLQQGRASR